MFHSPNCQAALKHNRGFRAESGGNYDLALQAIKRFERLAGDAIESFAAEIFGNAVFRAVGTNALASAGETACVCGDHQIRP